MLPVLPRQIELRGTLPKLSGFSSWKQLLKCGCYIEWNCFRALLALCEERMDWQLLAFV